MKHGFIKVATATPHVTVADCDANLNEILRLWEKANAANVALLVFPELCLTGCSCGDLFRAETLLSAAKRALGEFLQKTADSHMISIIGFPIVVNNKLYNSAAICQKGQILGLIPQKKIIFDAEGRYFSTPTKEPAYASVLGQTVPFGVEQIFSCETVPSFSFGVEIGNDFQSICPPSARMSRAGATVLINPTACPETVVSADFRRSAVASYSARTVSAYLYANCGKGESTTDTVFSGHSLIAENGKVL
ncbi:MAG: NAD(+) synthase, partial [Clostridia bacterium]|nr:NAD(+) synthase [Clostridia bacterium]